MVGGRRAFLPEMDLSVDDDHWRFLFRNVPNARARRARTLRSNNPEAAAAMKISIQSLLEGARNANGAVAVIDTFRAFTTAAVALANGASRIIMVATVEEALALRAAETGAICMGEVRVEAPDGFDYGNSPFEIATVDLRGKTIIQRTSAGTQGIVAASARADRLYAASLVTAEATVRALLAGSPGEVTIVAMGDNGIIRTDEDELTAIHLRNRLEGRPRQQASCAASHSGWRRGRGGFTIPPGSVIGLRMSKSPYTSTATILPSGSNTRTGDRSRDWSGRRDFRRVPQRDTNKSPSRMGKRGSG